MSKKYIAVLAVTATVGGTLLTGCGRDSGPSTCAPMAMGSVALQSFSVPLTGGGSGGGSGGHSGGGSSSGGNKSGGSSSGGSSGSYGGSKSSGSSGGSSSGSNRMPASAPDRGYHPAPGQPNYTYVRQPNGSWLPFLGGVIAGDALSSAPAGC